MTNRNNPYPSLSQNSLPIEKVEVQTNLSIEALAFAAIEIRQFESKDFRPRRHRKPRSPMCMA